MSTCQVIAETMACGDIAIGGRGETQESVGLERATPTRVANTMTVNPVAAGLLATQLVGEPITPSLVLGLAAVFAGIWIAATEVRKP
jgi:drug/metabolite transporter (DMT)-like permease